MIVEKVEGILNEILICGHMDEIHDNLHKLNPEILSDEHEKRLLWTLKELSVNRVVQDVKKIPYGYLASSFENSEIVTDLKKLIESSGCQILRARFYDCLWIHKHNATAARNAYRGYSQTIQDGKEIEHFQECFYRQISLAKALNDQILHDAIKRDAKIVLSQFEKVEDFRHYNILKSCKEQDILVPEELVECCDIRVKMNLKYDLEDAYLELKEVALAEELGVPLNKKFFKNTEIISVRRQRVDLILSEVTQSQHLYEKINMYKRAITLLRKIPSSETERTNIRHILNKQQTAFVELMPIYPVNADISKVTAYIENCIEVLNNTELVLYFLRVLPLKKPEVLKEETIRDNRESLGRQLFPIVELDKKGKNKMVLPSLDENNEASVLANMEYDIRKKLTLGAKIYLITIMQELRKRGYTPQEEVEKIVNRSGFVPTARRGAFVQGIMAGFAGDYLTALSILAPQVEHAVRYMAEICGDIVYGMNEQGKESVRTLDDILRGSCLKDCIDEQLLLYIKAVFVSEYGFNMRNEIAHGLLDADFHSLQAVSVWWFTFRLCYEFCSQYDDVCAEVNRKLYNIKTKFSITKEELTT